MFLAVNGDGKYVSCLNTSEEVYLFLGTKVKEHRFAFVLSWWI